MLKEKRQKKRHYTRGDSDDIERKSVVGNLDGGNSIYHPRIYHLLTSPDRQSEEKEKRKIYVGEKQQRCSLGVVEGNSLAANNKKKLIASSCAELVGVDVGWFYLKRIVGSSTGNDYSSKK